MGEIPPNQIDNATIMGIITVLILIRAVLAVLNTGDTMSATHCWSYALEYTLDYRIVIRFEQTRLQ